MSELRFLLSLAGEAALLLWGLHMVQSGVQRAFGGQLRRMVGAALRDRWRGFAAGVGVTALLQSSTATALIIGSFAAAGTLGLVPALAAMLGANLGTALVVQVLSFDAAALFAPLLLAGVLAFRRGRAARTRDLGRAGIGLGLMLLALRLLVETMRAVEASPALAGLLDVLAGAPVATMLLAALLAWAAHSSVAAILMVATLAAGGAVGPEAALAMVLGANLGSAVNPVLAVGGSEDRSRLRVPLSNLANRAVGCAIAWPLIPAAAAWLGANPSRLVADFHLLFNLVLAALTLPLLGPIAALLRRALPQRAAADDPGAPRYLDEAALATPSVALANASREALRMADLVEEMLRGSAAAFRAADRDTARAVTRTDDSVDRLHRALHDYLSHLPREALDEDEMRRLEEIRGFAINMEHAGDAVDRGLARHASKLARRGVGLNASEVQEVTALHEQLLGQLRLAVTVFMLGDLDAARRLVRGKERLRQAEAAATRRLAEAGEGVDDGGVAGLLLDVARDVKHVSSHIAATAHPRLERAGLLRESRLAPMPDEADHHRAD